MLKIERLIICCEGADRVALWCRFHRHFVAATFCVKERMTYSLSDKVAMVEVSIAEQVWVVTRRTGIAGRAKARKRE
jgi:hypothetical protein